MKSTNDSIRTISHELSKAYRGKVTNLGAAVITTAYVLTVIQENQTVSTSSLNEFIHTAKLSSDVSEAIERNLNGLWSTVKNYIGCFDIDDLKDVVLYDNSLIGFSTPECLANLAGMLLGISESDKVLDLCSGSASFPVYAFQDVKAKEYIGVEINYSLNDIANLRVSLLDKNYSLVLNNALTYQYTEKFDKVFSNYPFGLRNSKGSDLEKCRYGLQEYFDLDSANIARCSSDWLFNALIIRALNNTGKAVAIMTNGAASNKPDMYMRQYFAEKGFIEAVINLGPALNAETMVSTSMIVFSQNNNSIRLVNAENIYSKMDRRLNMLSNDDIKKILECVSEGGENTIDLSPAEMREHDYNMIASHYLEKPPVEDGVCFGEVIRSITRGSQVKADFLESYKSVMPTKYRYLALSNVSNGLIDIEEGQQFLTELPKSLEKFVIPDNAIVLAKMASPTFRSAVVNSDNEHTVVATGNLFIIEIDESKADPYYIQAFFDSAAGEAAVDYVAGGSTIRSISTEAVKNIVIPLPSLDEQKIIAQKYQAALDEYTVLKRKLKKVMERKRTLLDNEG